MLRNTAIGLAVTASLAVATLAPAFADIPKCMAQPNAETCPTFGTPTPSNASEQYAPKSGKHTYYRSPHSPNRG